MGTNTQKPQKPTARAAPARGRALSATAFLNEAIAETLFGHGRHSSKRTDWIGHFDHRYPLATECGLWRMGCCGALEIGRPIQPRILLWPKPLDLRLERGFDRPVRRLNGDHARPGI